MERHLIGRVISEEGQTKGRVTRIVRLTDKVAKVCSELQKELQPLTRKSDEGEKRRGYKISFENDY